MSKKIIITTSFAMGNDELENLINYIRLSLANDGFVVLPYYCGIKEVDIPEIDNVVVAKEDNNG